MKRFITFSIISLFIGCVAAMAQLPTSQRITYQARYHFGLIQITAGTATINFTIDGDNISGTFDGHSIPWHGRQYTVNDTLQARIDLANSHEHVAYENAWYTKPQVAALHNGTYDKSNPENFKDIYGHGKLDANPGTMEAVNVTADIIALYYIFRQLDFNSMTAGQCISLNIDAPGLSPRHVVIRYMGESTFNGSPTYNVVFEYCYTGDSGNYPVNCQVDQKSRVPLFFSSNIKIGQVELVIAT